MLLTQVQVSPTQVGLIAGQSEFATHEKVIRKQTLCEAPDKKSGSTLVHA